MDHTNPALVRYRLVRMGRETESYREAHIDGSTVWAEPDVQRATEWMRALAGGVALRKRIGAAAAARTEAENPEARDGRFLEELQFVAEQRRTISSRRFSPVGEMDDDAHVGTRLARKQSLERDLAWIKSRPSFRFADAMKRTLKSAFGRREPSGSPASKSPPREPRATAALRTGSRSAVATLMRPRRQIAPLTPGR